MTRTAASFRVIIATSAALLLWQHGLSSPSSTLQYLTAQYLGKSLSAMRLILARQDIFRSINEDLGEGRRHRARADP